MDGPVKPAARNRQGHDELLRAYFNTRDPSKTNLPGLTAMAIINDLRGKEWGDDDNSRVDMKLLFLCCLRLGQIHRKYVPGYPTALREQQYKELETMASVEQEIFRQILEVSDVDIVSASEDVKTVFVGRLLIAELQLLARRSEIFELYEDGMILQDQEMDGVRKSTRTLIELNQDRRFQEWIGKHPFVTTYTPAERFALLWTFRFPARLSSNQALQRIVNELVS